MNSFDEFPWPVETLGRILHFLAMDGAAFAWHHLSYLTHNNHELKTIADKMQRPLVLRISFDGADETKFILPFREATVAHIEIDWGDSSPPEIINEVGEGDAEHEYKAGGEYTVSVFPHGRGVDGVWLDHLGWKLQEPWIANTDIDRWWRPLRRMFAEAAALNQPIGSWNVSKVTDMSKMFCMAHSFDQPIGDWDIGYVFDMTEMFYCAKSFNQDIGDWGVSRVEKMDQMFQGALAIYPSYIDPWNLSPDQRGDLF